MTGKIDTWQLNIYSLESNQWYIWKETVKIDFLFRQANEIYAWHYNSICKRNMYIQVKSRQNDKWQWQLTKI